MNNKCNYNNISHLISVVTIVYNGRDVVEGTFLSVINQTYKYIEYIVIDGGSTDGTLDVIKNYDNEIDYWTSENDKGISDAFNKGIIESKGDYIIFMNAGDRFYDNNTVARISKYAVKKYDLIYGKTHLNIGDRFIEKGHNINIFNNHKLPTSHQSIFYNRTIFEKYGFFLNRYKLAMDYEHYCRFRNKCNCLFVDLVISKMLYDGVSNVNPSETYMEYIRADLKNKSFYVFMNMLKYFIVKNIKLID
jgi:glycosyltransferase involved in cell wall biosynthesis